MRIYLTHLLNGRERIFLRETPQGCSPRAESGRASVRILLRGTPRGCSPCDDDDDDHDHDHDGDADDDSDTQHEPSPKTKPQGASPARTFYQKREPKGVNPV